MLKRTTGIMIYMYRLARGGHVFGGINWYVLLLREACSIKKKEQRLVDSESG
jgi:hypothetical protein